MKSEAFEMEVTPLWVKEFPFVGKIIGTERLKGKYGEDCRLHLKGESLSTFAFDAWGENKNFLINTLGSNTGNWVGAVIRIVKDGDARRIVEAKA